MSRCDRGRRIRSPGHHHLRVFVASLLGFSGVWCGFARCVGWSRFYNGVFELFAAANGNGDGNGGEDGVGHGGLGDGQGARGLRTCGNGGDSERPAGRPPLGS